MKTRPVSLNAAHGIVGGLLAGAVVALWFFAVDISTTQAFWTPARLASAVLGEPFVSPTARLVLLYTLLHFGVFATLGGITGLLLPALDIAPGYLVGAFFGIGVLNTAHYGGLLVTDADLITVLPVGHVLAANLAGGMVLMAYLRRVRGATTSLVGQLVKEYPVIADGLVTGMVGAAAVALWFLVLDIVLGIPFRTPAALGSAVLLGADAASEVHYTLGVIAAYTALHLLAFACVGVAFAWVAGRIEQYPAFWLLPVLAFVVLEGLFIGLVGIRSDWVLGAQGWWAIGVGNLAAVSSMGWWVWRAHPGLRRVAARGLAETRV